MKMKKMMIAMAVAMMAGVSANAAFCNWGLAGTPPQQRMQFNGVFQASALCQLYLVTGYDLTDPGNPVKLPDFLVDERRTVNNPVGNRGALDVAASPSQTWAMNNTLAGVKLDTSAQVYMIVYDSSDKFFQQSAAYTLGALGMSDQMPIAVFGALFNWGTSGTLVYDTSGFDGKLLDTPENRAILGGWTPTDGWSSTIPEPTAMALLALGAAAVGLRRRFRK